MRMFFLGMMVALTPSLIVLAWTLRNAEDLSDVRESKKMADQRSPPSAGVTSLVPSERPPI
jgi:hypothetical protein